MLRYAITPGKLLPHPSSAEAGNLMSRCVALAEDGVDFLLLREKALPIAELVALTRQVVAAVSGSGLRVMTYSVPETGEQSGSRGVHVSAGAGSGRIREIKMGFPGTYCSVSCHTVGEVREARAGGADAVLFAPVFGKTVDGVEVALGAGLVGLRAACDAAGAMPVFALGGVDAGRVADCVEAGAAGVAGIRMFFED